MLLLKNFLDKLSPKAATPEIQEAEKENRQHDDEKFNQSIWSLQRASDEFANAVNATIRDLQSERRTRRGHEKAHSRTGKT